MSLLVSAIAEQLQWSELVIEAGCRSPETIPSLLYEPSKNTTSIVAVRQSMVQSRETMRLNRVSISFLKGIWRDVQILGGTPWMKILYTPE